MLNRKVTLKFRIFSFLVKKTPDDNRGKISFTPQSEECNLKMTSNPLVIQLFY
jgi:hypothetical protein